MKYTWGSIFLFLLAIPSGLYAQSQSSIRTATTSASTMYKEDNLTNTIIDSAFLYTVERRQLNQLTLPTVKITNVKSIQLQNPVYAKNTRFPTSMEPTVFITMERKQAIAIIGIPHFVQQQDGSIEQIISYQIELQENNQAQHKTTGSRVYASNSVLASGQFYKIAVTQQGMYKVDYNFIKNTLGIDPSTINPANIRLYGNGGEMLDESNKIFRQDDLVENAIQVVDGGDGQFNNGDYFLFYANGPTSIRKDSMFKKFTHNINLYTDMSTYFLNFDLGVGKRISADLSNLTPNIFVTSFNDFLYHEKDSSNPAHFGKSWYGEEFSDNPGRYLNRSFSFDMSNIDVNSPIQLKNVVGAIASTGTSTMNVTANGVATQSISLSDIGSGGFDSPVIRLVEFNSSISLNSPSLTLQFNFQKGSSSAVGFLDYFELNFRRNLVSNGYTNFADWNSVAAGNIANYQIQNANSNSQIWDITDPLVPTKMTSTLTGSTISFTQNASSLHRFVAFDGSILNTPTYVEKIQNQNLHHSSAIDYIIVTVPSLKSEAERLANYHATKQGYKTLVVTTQEIYNEFSSGTQDLCAIRDFVKMYYDKANLNEIPKYLLLFGDASYDYKNRISNNTNVVPTFETIESVSKTRGYCTDDFFGFLDDNEDINNYSGSQINTLDIGIGRFPVTTTSTAADIINKIMIYDSPASFGPWKNTLTFSADDQDSDLHLNDAESIEKTIRDSLPVYNNYKIYVDGYVQQSTPAGPRSPDANKAVVAQLYNGTFLMNYNGHGGPGGWCEERIFSMDDINNTKNLHRLPLFITATCDFAPFDNPAVLSAGEILLLKPDGGGIALMTTTQLVFAYQNQIMNNNYAKVGFKLNSNNKYPTLGDAYRLSKNIRYINYLDIDNAANFRKFALLGDPALTLAFPKHKVFTDSVNGISIATAIDTLKALSKYTISGHVADIQGNILNNYNGVVYPVIFDKPKKLTTLQNDPDSPKKDYYVQNNALYKGKATVKNGKFTFTFVVPKDINYDIAKGKISYYANNETEDASGYDASIYVGGSTTNPNTDNAGPIIKPYLNDEKFANGGITTANSTLLVKLFDDNGINYTGNSIGHDITAKLDGNAQTTYVLNNFFEAELDDYRAGTVKFPLNDLTEGEHTIVIKAWDIFNNSSEAVLHFVVVNSTKGKLARVYNYPNPFTTHTEFMFEHNLPNQNLSINISIFSITGKMVKQIHTMVNSEGVRVNGIAWDGKDSYGDKLGKGVYLYKLSVKAANGFSDQVIQKLVVLQ